MKRPSFLRSALALASSAAITASLLVAPTAFAAAGTVTNTAPAMTVGTNVPATTITVDIAAAADVTNGETFTFTFPANFPAPVNADCHSQAVNDGFLELSALSIGGHDVLTADDGVTCSAAGQVLTVTIADVADMDGSVNALTDGDDLVLTFGTATDTAGTAAPSYAGTVGVNTAGAANILVATTSDATINVAGTSDITVSAADAAASVARGTATVGVNDLALTFTTPRPLVVGETINVTLPASFTVANGTDVVAGSITDNNGSSTLTTSAAGQVLTLTVATATLTDADSGSSTHVVTIPGNNAIAGYVDTTDITTFTVQTSGAANIATDSAVALTDVTAADAAASIVRGTATTGANNLALTIASPRPLIVGDKINVTLPASFTVADGTDVVAGSITNNNGSSTLTTSAAGQVLTLTVATATLTDADGGAAAHVITIPGNNATANYVDTTDVSTFTITTSGDVNIATDSAVALTDTTAADAAATVVKAEASVINSTSDLTIAFTLPAAVPTGSFINITFPDYYTISATTTAVAASSISGACDPGTTTATVSEPSTNVLRLTVATTDLTAGACSVVVSGTNAVPNAVGSTDITSFVVERSGGADIATDSDVALTNAGGGSSSSDSVAPAAPTDFTATVSTDNKVTLTWKDPADADLSKVEILRGISPAPVSGTPVETVFKGAQTYTDTTVTSGQIVTYQLRVRDTSDNSTMSKELTLTVKAAATVEAPEGSAGSTTTTDTTTTTTDTTTPATETPTDTVQETVTEETLPDGTVKVTVTTEDGTTVEVDVSAVAAQAGTTADKVTEAADTFSDLSVTHWSVGYIARAMDAGILAGDPAGTVRPNDNANRAELAKIAAKAFGLTIPETVTTAPFTDVAADAWFAPFVSAVKTAGVKGYADGTYQPAKSVNRAEALALLLTAAGIDYSSADVEVLPFTDIAKDAWYAKAVAFAYENGIVSGKTAGTFDPSATITRAEISKITVEIVDYLNS